MMQQGQDDKGQKYDNLLRWFLKEGGYMGDLKFARFPPSNYLGIAAGSDIKKNTIIMGIPKKLIIGINRVRQSQLSEIIDNQAIFSGEASDDRDFNILTFFIIFQKMKEEESFYAPYLKTVELAETLISWNDEQIEQIGDPYLNISFIRDIRKDFEPTFAIFTNIVNKNRHLFKKQLTKQLFDFSYGLVMTRCFGWGLPQTMIVPFADFLNHYSNGVHHYVFSLSMENQNNEEYIKKSSCLDLRIFGKDNTSSLPIAYQKDSRQIYIQKHSQILEKHGIIFTQDIRSIPNKESRQLLRIVQNKKIQQHFDQQLNLSSESEDNDSIDEEQYFKNDPSMIDKIKQIPYLRRFYEIRDFFKKIDHLVDTYKDQRYNEPSPEINREFQDDVGFSWWYKTQDAQFIVSTSRNTAKGEQIYNSYGRRNNRFLLLWYGFTFSGNKYDSVAFRIWSPTVEMKTGRLVFAKYLTQKEWKERIPIGNSRYAFSQLSHEFRLKLTSLNYHLLAFLRFRKLSSTKQRRHLLSQNRNLISITDISLEIQIFLDYLKILNQLEGEYNLSTNKLEIKALHRRCFAQILIQSNRSIMHSHLKGAAYILRLLNKFIGLNKKQIILIDIYKQPWSLDQSEQERVNNRFFVNHYFKMLRDFQNI